MTFRHAGRWCAVPSGSVTYVGPESNEAQQLWGEGNTPHSRSVTLIAYQTEFSLAADELKVESFAPDSMYPLSELILGLLLKKHDYVLIAGLAQVDERVVWLLNVNAIPQALTGINQ